MTEISFSDIAIVSCGTLSLELNFLKKESFLDTEHLFYTTPGLHRDIPELERQLIKRINKAREKVDKVIVVYGGKFCYVNADQPTRLMQTIIEEQGAGVARIQATHCMDMLADEEERDKNRPGDGRRRTGVVDDTRMGEISTAGVQRMGQGPCQRKFSQAHRWCHCAGRYRVSRSVYGRTTGSVPGILRLDGHPHAGISGDPGPIQIADQ